MRCARRAPAESTDAGTGAVTEAVVDIVDGTVVDVPADMVIAKGDGSLVTPRGRLF